MQPYPVPYRIVVGGNPLHIFAVVAVFVQFQACLVNVTFILVEILVTCILTGASLLNKYEMGIQTTIKFF